LVRKAGGVAAGSPQAGDEAHANWVYRKVKDDRDDRCHLLCRGGPGCRRDDDIDLEPDEFSGDF
jgi:hypothetical protein